MATKTKRIKARKTKAATRVIPHRVIDLGREEQLVTWNEWFARTQDSMHQIVPKEKHDQLQFRITLIDGRQFQVRQLFTHLSRGVCSLEKSRWNELEAVCDVITGYLMVGADEDDALTALSVPPAEIMSVECVYVPGDEEKTPFGFYAREGLNVPAQRREVEERALAPQDSYGE